MKHFCIKNPLVQLHAAHGQLWTRISAQVYNDLSDVERLGEAVIAETR